MNPTSGSTSGSKTMHATASTPPPLFQDTALTEIIKKSDDAQKHSLAVLKAQGEQKISGLVTVLKMYDPRFTREVMGFLPLRSLSHLAQCILILLPAKKNPELAQKAFEKFLNFKRTFPQKADQYFQAYKAYLQNCKLSPSLQNVYVGLAHSILGEFNDLATIATPLTPQLAPIESRRLALMNVAQLIKEFSQFHEAFLDESSKDLSAYIGDYQESLSKLSNTKKHFKAHQKTFGFDTRHFHYGHTQQLYESAIKWLKQLKLYSLERVPTIKYHCSRLDMTSPHFLHQIDTVLSLGQRCKKGVEEIITPLMEGLTAFEVDLSFYSGVPATSVFSTVTMRDLYRKILSAEQSIFIHLTNVIQKFIEEVSERKKKADKEEQKDLQKEVPETLEQDLFQCLAMQLDPKKNKIKQQARAHNHPADPYIERLLNECAVASEEAKKRLHSIYFSITKSEHHADYQTRSAFTSFSLNVLDLGKYTCSNRNHLRHLHFAGLESALHRWLLVFANVNSQITSRDSDEIFNKWVENILKEASQQASSKSKKLNNLDILTARLSHTSTVIDKVHAFATSVHSLCQHLFTALKQARDQIPNITVDDVVKADDSLHLLELEEESAAAQKAYADAEKLQKENLAKAAKSKAEAEPKTVFSASKSPVQLTTTAKQPLPPPPTRATSPLNTPFGNLVFDLRNELAAWYGMNQATVTPPADVAESFLPNSELAIHQQLYANDGLSTTLEMLAHCTRVGNKTLLIQMVLQWGYLALEQGLTAQFAKAFPHDPLRHDLSALLQGIGVQQSNLWTEHARSQTLYHRYPWYFQASASKPLPFALRHIREENAESAKKFSTDFSKWIEDAMSLQIGILTHQNKQSAELKKMQTVLDSFRKEISGVQAKTAADKKATETISKENDAHLSKFEKQIQTALELLRKRFKSEPALSEDAIKALSNALHHLANLRGTLGLLRQFPQQRFMHVLLQMLASSVKNFTENLGVVLSLQQGNGWYTHSLNSYCKDYGLGEKLSSKLLSTLKNIDVEKGDEYPYKYFTNISAKAASPLMLALSEFYVRSKEASLMGEGAIPGGMKKKSVAELQSEICEWAEQFAELACALTTKHLT